MRIKTALANSPKAVEDCHDLLLWLIPHLDKLPRTRRFTLGERLESRLLAVLEALVEAAYSSNKRSLLAKANRDLEICRHLWRLCFEFRAIPIKSYEDGSQLMLSLGQQIGGWFKASQPAP